MHGVDRSPSQWRICPSQGSVGEGESALPVANVLAISQHTMSLGDEGVQEEA